MKTLLLVDDELALVDTLTSLLELEGYQVVSAANGRSGLQKLQEGRIEVVVADVMMPILGGLDMLRMMRAMPDHASTPAILISAAPKWAILRPNEALGEDGFENGLFQAFLQKPFDLPLLLSTLARLVGPGDPSSHGPESRA